VGIEDIRGDIIKISSVTIEVFRKLSDENEVDFTNLFEMQWKCEKMAKYRGILQRGSYNFGKERRVRVHELRNGYVLGEWGSNWFQFWKHMLGSTMILGFLTWLRMKPECRSISFMVLANFIKRKDWDI
jgi:hypothetical protein